MALVRGADENTCLRRVVTDHFPRIGRTRSILTSEEAGENPTPILAPHQPITTMVATVGVPSPSAIVTVIGFMTDFAFVLVLLLSFTCRTNCSDNADHRCMEESDPCPINNETRGYAQTVVLMGTPRRDRIDHSGDWVVVVVGCGRNSYILRTAERRHQREGKTDRRLLASVLQPLFPHSHPARGHEQVGEHDIELLPRDMREPITHAVDEAMRLIVRSNDREVVLDDGLPGGFLMYRAVIDDKDLHVTPP